MKIRLVIVASVLSFVFCLSACQRTPEYEENHGIITEKKEKIETLYSYEEIKQQIPMTYEGEIVSKTYTVHIDANVDVPADRITMGNLITNVMDWQKLCDKISPEEKMISIENRNSNSAENQQEWAIIDFDRVDNDMGWVKSLSVTGEGVEISFNDYELNANESIDYTIVDPDEKSIQSYNEMAKEILSKLELPYSSELMAVYEEPNGDEYAWMNLTLQIDGGSAVKLTNGDFTIIDGKMVLTENDELKSLYLIGNYKIESNSECELASWDDIMTKFGDFINDNQIALYEDLTITQISLEYMAKESDDQLQYIPVWTFKIDDKFDSINYGKCVYAAVNAITGELEYALY